MIRNTLIFILLIIFVIVAICLLIAIKQTGDGKKGNKYHFSRVYHNRDEKVYDSFWAAYWRHSLYNLLDIFSIFSVL